ncbi:hypothetical protein, partial [Streptomyces virginiae]|uniref:hypothetical protein n=1 Tax=Streptomyces virginiae TaxID=1961 RepID=UPI00343C04E7
MIDRSSTPLHQWANRQLLATYDAVVCSLCLSTDEAADHVLPAMALADRREGWRARARHPRLALRLVDDEDEHHHAGVSGAQGR